MTSKHELHSIDNWNASGKKMHDLAYHGCDVENGWRKAKTDEADAGV